MNTDCWFYALSFLPPSERVRARLVSPTWCRMIDLIDTSQKDLQIVITPGPVTSGTGEPSTTVHSSDNSKLSIDGSSIVVPRLHYDTFCRLLARFGRNLKNFTIEAFDQWSDHHVLRMVEAAPKLISFRLMACKYFGGNDDNYFGFQSVTQFGWSSLTNAYAAQLQVLEMEDCDLESRHLALIVDNFRQLRNLNVANNSGVTNYQALARLPATLEVLKVGPKLSMTSRRTPTGQRYQHYEMPIELIVTWAGNLNKQGRDCQLRSLQLQGYLTARLQKLATIDSLRELRVKYVSFASQDLFNYEIDVLTASLRHIRQLDTLKLYQFNAINCELGEMQWVRDQLLSQTEATCSCDAKCNTSQSSSKFVHNLRSFSLTTKKPLIVIDQVRLLSLILTSCVRLEAFALISSRFDAQQVYLNLNHIVPSLLGNHGHRLRELRLVNIFDEIHPRLLWNLLTGGVCPHLERLIVDDGNVSSFLEWLVQLIGQLGPNDSRREHPIQLVILVDNLPEKEKDRQLQHYQQLVSSRQAVLSDIVHVIFRASGRDEIAVTEDGSDKFDMLGVGGGGGGVGHNQQQLGNSEAQDDDDDLSDLCHLIDSGCNLVNKVIDSITLVANCGSLMVAYWMLVRPTRLFSLVKSILDWAR